jgi:hypothetical protein
VPFIRKARAGNDSFGNSWPSDGAVIEVAPEHAMALLAILDGQFSEVTPTAAPDPDEISEAPRPRRGRPPKASTDPEPIQE